MSSHEFACRLSWSGAKHGAIRDYAGYSREYLVEVEGKPPLRGSAATAFHGDAALHNPEELLIAALSACHFLSYAALCGRSGLAVLAYNDEATGVMAFDRTRKVMCFSEVMLRPRVMIAHDADAAKALALHGRAHADCFIANSVNFPVRHQPQIVVADTPTGNQTF